MRNSDYHSKQQMRDREYAAAWDKLTARERAELAKAGINGPELPTYHTGKANHEACIAQSSDASVVNSDEPEPQMRTCDEAMLMSVLRRLLGEMMASDNVRLTLDCLALITGISYDGASMASIAKRHEVTRAAVSKRCVLIAESLGLPPSRAMRQLTARAVYERRARNSHSRSAH